MTARRVLPAGVLTFCLLTFCLPAFLPLTVASAQSPPAPRPPEVRIVSPGRDAYVSGPTLLRALVDPPEGVSSVVFFVDGRLVCTTVLLPFECDWDFGRSVVEHQVRVVVNPTAGRRIVQTVRTKGLDYAENVDVDVVQVTVTVTDSNGKFVKGLQENAFHVFEDGRSQKISHFASEDVPLELIVAIDVSGSMTAAMPKLKKAVKDFLAEVPTQHQVTLLGFNDSIFTMARKATNLQERMRAVDRLSSWGATALYDVILRSIDLLGRQAGRKAIVVFTDGEDQGSHSTIADVERRLQSTDVTLYLIGQGRAVSAESLRRTMQRLASPTGGRALFTENVDTLHNAFNDLLEELSNQYLLGYPPVDLQRDDRWRRITVTVDGQQEIRARQGYRVARQK